MNSVGPGESFCVGIALDMVVRRGAQEQLEFVRQLMISGVKRQMPYLCDGCQGLRNAEHQMASAASRNKFMDDVIVRPPGVTSP